MCEKKNENEDEAENEGPRTNRRGEVLMSTVEMGGRGRKEPKRVKGAAGALALFGTFASDDSAFSQFPRLFRNGPVRAIRVGTIRVTAKQRWLQLLTK